MVKKNLVKEAIDGLLDPVRAVSSTRLKALKRQLKQLHLADITIEGDKKNKGYVVFCHKVSDTGVDTWHQYAVKREYINDLMLSRMLMCLDNVFITVNTMRNHNRNMSGIFTYNALFLDIDLKGWSKEERDNYYNLPHVKERLSKLRPSLIIRTPHGYHEYCLIEGCWGRTNSMKYMWQDAQDALIDTCMEADPQANDSARVLRASGFHNTLKDNPFDVYTYYEEDEPVRRPIIDYLDILKPDWREEVEQKKDQLREERKKAEERAKRAYETAEKHKEAGTYVSKKELYERASEKGIYVKGSTQALHHNRLQYYESLINRGYVSHKADGSGRRKRIIFFVALSLFQIDNITPQEIWNEINRFNKKFKLKLTKAELETATYSVLVKKKVYHYKSITILKDLGLLQDSESHIGLFIPDTPEAANIKREARNAKRRLDYDKATEEARKGRKKAKNAEIREKNKRKNEDKKRRSEGQISKRQQAYTLFLEGYTYIEIGKKIRGKNNKITPEPTVRKWVAKEKAERLNKL